MAEQSAFRKQLESAVNARDVMEVRTIGEWRDSVPA